MVCRGRPVDKFCFFGEYFPDWMYLDHSDRVTGQSAVSSIFSSESLASFSLDLCNHAFHAVDALSSGFFSQA